MKRGLRNEGGLIAAVLADPARAHDLDAAGWSMLIGQARNADMLGQLHFRLASGGALGCAPQAARRHLDLAWELSCRHRDAVRWEVFHIATALRKLDVPVVLLKGAAYCLGALPAAEGRVFNDVDIMVPHAALTAVEYALLDAGWIPQVANDYDQRYYRRWMHEIPRWSTSPGAPYSTSITRSCRRPPASFRMRASCCDALYRSRVRGGRSLPGSGSWHRKT